MYILLSATTFCIGQSKLYDLVWKDLEAIQKTTKDPVIIVGPEKTFSITSIRIKSNSNVIIWEWYYLIYKKGNRNFVIRYVETLTPLKNQKLFKSKPAEFLSDTLFSLLKNRQSEILSEEILPFIYKDTINGVTAFKEGFLMHTNPFSLSIHFVDKRFQTFEFDHIAMRPTLMPGVPDLPINLNFDHNRLTNIFHVYSYLQDFLSGIDEKFEFP